MIYGILIVLEAYHMIIAYLCAPNVSCPPISGDYSVGVVLVSCLVSVSVLHRVCYSVTISFFCDH